MDFSAFSTPSPSSTPFLLPNVGVRSLTEPVKEIPHNNFWIFGYGSLIFKPPPDIEMSSHDHRGTPTAPGRVVTLIEREYWETLDDPHAKFERPDSRTWGVAYKIIPERVRHVSAVLDLREQNSYTVHIVPFSPSKSASSPLSTISTIVYIGTPDNDAFAGVEADLDGLAKLILTSKGPSGYNKEYLYKLGDALVDLHGRDGEEDDYHVVDLVRRVKKLEAVEDEIIDN
ncbi:ChaC-like protein-domain-containing protein [Lipomyces chichibuensis]|uniref:ChaC-like protein-domain-containing protein n=1 Tax=Lipomyces chichibuensis TaxID=1546026 RepID=UPI0033430212